MFKNKGGEEMNEWKSVARNEWTFVSDRVPDTDRYVLVITTDGNYHISLSLIHI